MRSNMPRFKEGALEANLVLVERVRELATKKGVTPGQLALAWVHAQVGRRSQRAPSQHSTLLTCSVHCKLCQLWSYKSCIAIYMVMLVMPCAG